MQICTRAMDTARLKGAIVVLSIVLSTILLLLASLSNIELAWCTDGKEMTLQSLVDNGDVSGMSVQWLLHVSVLFGFARLVNHCIKCVAKAQTWHFLMALDIAEGILISAMVMVAIVITLSKVLQNEACSLQDANSPFLGILIASNAISISVSLFDIITLVFENAYSYQEVVDTQEQQDQGIASDCVGSDANEATVVSLKVESDGAPLDANDAGSL